MRANDAKVGTKVRSNVAFSGVPKGTKGTIVEDYGSGVMVEWDHDQTEGWEPLRDGFNKSRELEYLDLLHETR